VKRRKERKERFRVRCKLDALVDPPHGKSGASDQIARFHSNEEFHGAAVLHLQLLRESINCRSLSRWRALHGKEQLVFLRIEPGCLRCTIAEAKEMAEFIAKVRQGLVSAGVEPSGLHIK
jgi:hypothetical protein